MTVVPAACRPRLLRRDPVWYFAAASMTSFAVLGWLLAQWVSIGVVEHSHLGESMHHHHPYAGPLALAMTITATCSLLGVFAARLRHGPTGTRIHSRSKHLLVPASVAAGLFVAVESYELHMMGREHDSSAMTFLITGAGLQLALLPASWALNRKALAVVERCADATQTPRRFAAPLLDRQLCASLPRAAGELPPRTWPVRGPPALPRFHLLLPSAAPALA